MRRILLITLPVLLLFFSCQKDNTFPKTETVTKGQKWGIRIGSTPAEVYAQLQQLGQEKENFNEIEIIDQQYKLFTQPDEIGPRITLYSGISIEKQNTVYSDRVIITFYENKVSGIDEGGGLTDPRSRWPQDAAEEIALQRDEDLSRFYDKFQAIYNTGALDGYAIRLSSKALGKPFDPVMADYNKWNFVFTDRVSYNVDGRSTVTLYFKGNKLDKIHIEYSEFEITP